MRKIVVPILVLSVILGLALARRCNPASTGPEAGRRPGPDQTPINDRTPDRVRKTPPDPSRTPTSSVDAPEQISTQIIGKYAESRKTIPDDPNYTRFIREELFHVREMRLLSKVYPEAAEKAALGIARDRSQEGAARLGAITMLGLLAERGGSISEKALLEMASSPDDELRDVALGNLMQADPEGKYRTLYRSRAREGQFGAVTALGRWADPDSTVALQEVYERGRHSPAPEGTASLFAEEALKQVRLLTETQDLTKDLAAILGPGSKRGRSWQDWALFTAHSKGLLPGLIEPLKSRLEAGDRHAALGQSNPLDTAEAAYAMMTSIILYDELLLAYSEGGGTLTEPQRIRLHTFGYLGDPKTRLEEILRDGR